MTQTENTLTLAPAAGSGIGKLVFDALLAREDFIPAMVEAAVGGLKATTSFYNPATREVLEKPDFKTRLQTWLALTAHAEGEPVKRIIHQHLNGEGKVDPLAALRESPELREAAKRMIENSEWRHSGRNTKKAEPIEPAADGPAGKF